MKQIFFILMSVLLLSTFAEAAVRTKHIISWAGVVVDTEAALAEREKRSHQRTRAKFDAPAKDVLYTYNTPISISSKAKSKMPSSFSKFLEPVDITSATQRSVRSFEKVIVGSNSKNRALETNTYYACAYENEKMMCLRDGFVLIVYDVKNILPDSFTRYLYTRDELEEIENFYLLD
jgi:hypothetical protein